MTHPIEDDGQDPTANDANAWLERSRLLFERSILSCSQIITFIQGLESSKNHSANDELRFTMMPTEMIVALYNVRTGIEDALMQLATLGLSPELQEHAQGLFNNKDKEDSTDLNLLFQRVVENDGPKGYLPIARVSVPIDSSIEANDEQYQGTLALLKELADKYQYYDLNNVPKAMSGACRKRGAVPNPFTAQENQKETCTQLETPPPEIKSILDPEEMNSYKQMAQEVLDDANLLYGQFCAVGSIYRSAVEQTCP